MVKKLDDEALEGFVLHDQGTKNPYMLQRIIRSWEKVHKKGIKLGKKNDVAKEPYTQWVKERVQQIKLPFTIDPLYCSDSHEPIPISVEEVNELKETVAQLEHEKEQMQQSLYHVAYERNELKFDLSQMEEQLFNSEEKYEIERGKSKWTL